MRDATRPRAGDGAHQGRGRGALQPAQNLQILPKDFTVQQVVPINATLFLAARRANAANKADDAIAYAKANLEFDPTSVRSYQEMSQAYTRKMDTSNAIAMMEKAVA